MQGVGVSDTDQLGSTVSNKASEVPFQVQNRIQGSGTGGVVSIEEQDYQERWKQTSLALLGLSILAAVATIAVGIWELVDSSGTKYIIAWSVGAFFASVSIPISLLAIHLHVVNYRSGLQRHYIRVLWMVPVYSIQSWCALRFQNQQVYLESFRAIYEAYVIYNFYALIRDFLGTTDEQRQQRLRSLNREYVTHLKFFWLCFTPLLPKWRLERQFLRQCLFGVIQ